MIPEQTLLEFPLFGDNATKVEPDNNKKSNGWQQGDVVPAEWMNWEWYHASKGVADLNKGVSSIEKEINNVLGNFNITPNGTLTNQLMAALDKLKQQAALAAHPVGSLYWTSSSENPAVTFGGGTWVQIKDRFILAAGDSYANGAAGGSATVSLSQTQIPPHTHTGTTGSESSNHNHSFATQVVVYNGGAKLCDINETSPTGALGTYNGGSETSANIQGHYHSFETNATGGGLPHDNMPPYIVKFCWERVS